MPSRRSFFGRIIGAAVAGFMPKPKLVARGGRLVDGGVITDTIHGVARTADGLSIHPPRLVPCYPQNVGMVSEAGNFPPLKYPTFPVVLRNPTPVEVTEDYHGIPVTVPAGGFVKVSARDLPIDLAHEQALDIDVLHNRHIARMEKFRVPLLNVDVAHDEALMEKTRRDYYNDADDDY